MQDGELACLNLLEPRLVESGSTPIFLLDDRVIFVSLRDYAEFSSAAVLLTNN